MNKNMSIIVTILGLLSVVSSSSRLFNLQQGLSKPSIQVQQTGEIEGFSKMTQTSTQNWTKVAAGLYLTTDEKSLSAIVCNKEGTGCKGIPFGEYKNYPVTYSQPIIVSTGKYMGGYFVAYYSKSSPTRVQIDFFNSPNYSTDTYLQVYRSQAINTAANEKSKFLNVSLVQKKSNPTKADYSLYIAL